MKISKEMKIFANFRDVCETPLLRRNVATIIQKLCADANISAEKITPYP